MQLNHLRNPIESIKEPIPQEWNDAQEHATSFTDDPGFIRYLHENGVDIEDKTNPRYMSLYYNHIASYYQTHQDLISDDALQRTLLLAEAPRIVDSDEEYTVLEQEYKHLNRLDQRMEDSRFRRYIDLKERLVIFNQRLSHYMHDHPHEKHEAITASLIMASLKHYEDDDLVERTIKQISKGALYEAVSRQMLECINLPVRPATVKEDMNGADLVLELGDEKIFIDIKASLDEVAGTDEGYHRIMEEKIFYAISRRDKAKIPVIVKIWPGIDLSNDSDGLCMLTDAAQEEKPAAFAVQLQRAQIEI